MRSISDAKCKSTDVSKELIIIIPGTHVLKIAVGMEFMKGTIVPKEGLDSSSLWSQGFYCVMKGVP